jgi:quinol monooxygenase YgiN
VRLRRICTTGPPADPESVTTKDDDPTSYRVFEVYASQAAFDAHMAGAGYNMMKKFLEDGALAQPPAQEFHSLAE